MKQDVYLAKPIQNELWNDDKESDFYSDVFDENIFFIILNSPYRMILAWRNGDKLKIWDRIWRIIKKWKYFEIMYLLSQWKLYIFLN